MKYPKAQRLNGNECLSQKRPLNKTMKNVSKTTLFETDLQKRLFGSSFDKTNRIFIIIIKFKQEAPCPTLRATIATPSATVKMQVALNEVYSCLDFFFPLFIS